jgi:hypothetical protein
LATKNVKKRTIPGVTIDTSDKSENTKSENTKSENTKSENTLSSNTSSNTDGSTNISKLRTKQKDISLNSKNNSTFSKRKYKRNVITIDT